MKIKTHGSLFPEWQETHPEPPHKIPARLTQMYRYYGKIKSKQCRDCIHLQTLRYSQTFFKCAKYGVTRSSATDWRKSWTACGLHKISSTDEAQEDLSCAGRE